MELVYIQVHGARQLGNELWVTADTDICLPAGTTFVLPSVRGVIRLLKRAELRAEVPTEIVMDQAFTDPKTSPKNGELLLPVGWPKPE